ncbi:hypothetical protein V6N00_09385 [Tersicoccus sp. MR15.9]|uniref:hypothetical protein n=1 Tax=Tersicoccus mangrovi TaxID=3121635 RepID=UPI002FE5309F
MSAAVDAASSPWPPAVDRRAGRRPTVGEAIRSLPWLVVVLVCSGVAMIPSLSGTPGGVTEEAALTGRAFSLTHLDTVVPSAWTAQPPLGWIQLGLITHLSGAFDRHELAIDATRETVLVATLVSTALVFWVCRRLPLSRPAATLAAAAFALTPLALAEHRLVVAENLATGWWLLAVLVATVHRWRLAAPATAVCLGIAALTAPSFLLAGVLPLWLLLRVGRDDRSPDGRPAAQDRSMLLTGGVLLALACGYLLVVAVFTIAAGPAGSPGSGAARPLGDAIAAWWALDPVSVTIGTLGTLGALLIRRVRPVAVTAALITAALLLPGLDVSPSAVVPLAALAAIGVAAVAERVTVSALRSTSRRRAAHRPVLGPRAAVAVVALVGTVAAGLAVWPGRWAATASADADPAASQAQRWVLQNVARDRRVVADDATWVALLHAGFSPARLVRYGAEDERVALSEPTPDALRAVDYVVANTAFRALADRPGPVATAFEGATLVGSFGTDADRVVVWQIEHRAATAPAGPFLVPQHVDAEQRRARSSAGAGLLADSRLTLTAGDRELIRSGRVDTRVLLLLARRIADSPVTVAAFPADPGTDGADRHRVLISSDAGRPTVLDSATAANLLIWARSLTGPLAPQSVDPTAPGVLIAYPLGEPAHLPGVDAAG